MFDSWHEGYVVHSLGSQLTDEEGMQPVRPVGDIPGWHGGCWAHSVLWHCWLGV